MAKALIPFSGGVNSTYALWRWLVETDHEIVASYAEEGWLAAKIGDDPWRCSRETTAVEKMVTWLKENVRDFTFEKTDVWPDYVENEQPIRDGFTNTRDYGIIAARYQGYSNLIDAHTPDIFVPGISLENTATDCEPTYRHLYLRDGMAVHYAGARNREAISDDFDYNAIAATLVGRFEQLDALPNDLRALIAPKSDDPWSDDDWGKLTKGYERVYEQSDMTGAGLDAVFAEHGAYGQWRGEADPATYVYRGAWGVKIAEILEIDISGPPE
jgi:hypothetical protein